MNRSIWSIPPSGSPEDSRTLVMIKMLFGKSAAPAVFLHPGINSARRLLLEPHEVFAGISGRRVLTLFGLHHGVAVPPGPAVIGRPVDSTVVDGFAAAVSARAVHLQSRPGDRAGQGDRQLFEGTGPELSRW